MTDDSKGPVFGIDVKYWWGVLVVIALLFGIFLLRTCSDRPERPDRPVESPGEPSTPPPTTMPLR